MFARMLDRARRHKASILPVLWGPVLSMAGIAIGTRVLTQVTSTSTFGEIKLVQGATGLAMGLVARPLTQFAMREYHEAKVVDRGEVFEAHVNRLQLQLALVLAILIVIGLAIARTTGLPLGWATVLVAWPSVVSETVLQGRVAFALTRNEQKKVSLVEVAKQWGLSFVAAGAMAWIADSAAVFLLSQAGFTAACLLAFRHGSGAVAPRPTDEERKGWNREALHFAIPMLGAALFNWFMSIGDRYLLARYCSTDEVGRYAAVYGLVSGPIVAVGGTASRLLFPLLFQAAAQKRVASQRAMIRMQFVLGVAVGFAAVGAVLLCGRWIVALLLAPAYREGALPLMTWIAAGHACLIVSFSLEMSAFARKRTSAFTISTGMAAATNLSLNLLWIPSQRAVGAAKATFACYVVYLIANSILLRPNRSERESLTESPKPKDQDG